jgi:DNA ligase (NAD+)
MNRLKQKRFKNQKLRVLKEFIKEFRLRKIIQILNQNRKWGDFEYIMSLIEIVKDKLKNRLNVKKVSRPKKCPVCNAEVLDEGAIIKCQNLSCPARAINSIIYAASKNALDIEGLGESVARALYENNLVKDITDIFSLKEEDLKKLPLFADKKAKNLINAMKKEGIDCWRFINALGIEHIGEVASKKICEKFGSNFYEVEPEKFLEIDGFGEEMVKSIKEYIDVNREKIVKLKEILKPNDPTKKVQNSLFSNKKVVLTGTMKRPRREIKELLESLGAKVLNSVSRNVDYLIVGENPGSKLQKAKELGVKVISEDEMFNLIGEKVEI